MIFASNRMQAKNIELYCSYILGSEAVGMCLDMAEMNVNKNNLNLSIYYEPNDKFIKNICYSGAFSEDLQYL